jgi:hypothetical protein
MSVYLQISDPSSGSSRWDCFASYRLAVRHGADDARSVRRDSWHRFSAKKRSHGWCDFAALSQVLDPRGGFLKPGDALTVATDITVLHESVAFVREADLGGGPPGAGGEVHGGRFTWRVHNFSAFRPLLRTQKIMSPAFPAGGCALRMSVYQSAVGGGEHLSVCLESKDTERGAAAGGERTAWCLFRLAVAPADEGANGGANGAAAAGAAAPRAVTRDSYGRFAADARGGDNSSLGWNDFMRMEDFAGEGSPYLVGDTAVFSAQYHVVRETASLARCLDGPRPPLGVPGRLSSGGAGAALAPRGSRRAPRGGAAGADADCAGRFTWRVENFTRLKDLLKKRKIAGLCIKSRRFTVGGRDCRLIAYPRGQSQPPTFLSLFLEVTDPRAVAPDWSAFVSHRLAVLNQRDPGGERSVAKESQNRYSKSAKDWGWREFVSLTALFDADAGFLVDDAVVFSAEVLVLREQDRAAAAAPDAIGGLALPEPPAAAAPAAPALRGASRAEARADAKAAAAAAAADAAAAPPAAEGEAAAADGAAALAPAAAAALPLAAAAPAPPSPAAPPGRPERPFFAWRIDNLTAFKEVVETRKVFSRFFSAGACDLRVGVYESFDSLCVYLEGDAAAGGAGAAAPPPPAPLTPPAPPAPGADADTDADAADGAAEGGDGGGGDAAAAAASPPPPGKPPNFWVRYRAAVADGREGGEPRQRWREGTLLTRSWNNSVLQFPRRGGGGPGASLSGGEGRPPPPRDVLAVVVEVLECRPWGDGDGDAAAPGGAGAPARPSPAAAGRGGDDARPAGGPAAGRLRLPGSDSDGASDPGGAPPPPGAGAPPPPPPAPAPRTSPASDAAGSDDLDSLDDFDASDADAEAEAEVEDALGRWLGAAGLELIGGGEGAPPALADAGAVQRALEASLARAPASLPMFAASLRMYMSTPARVRRLLLPCASPGAPPALAPGVLTLLAGLPALRAPLAAMLVDVMLDHCLTARMHAHRAAAAAARAAKAAAKADAAGGSAGATGVVADGAPVADGGAPEGGGATDGSPEKPRGGAAAAAAAADAEHVVGLILGWLRSLEPELAAAPPPLPPPPPEPLRRGGSGRAPPPPPPPAPPLSSLQKVSMLLADAPLALQPDVVALVPRLVEPGEHTAAAGALLARLAEASREGPGAEAALRLPVLGALGALRIDPGVAEKVLAAALEALPALSDAELPPAVGLVLKLAAGGGAACAPAARAVRARLRGSGGAGGAPPPPGALDALRLAVAQHADVAAALLADVATEARGARRGSGSGSGAAAGGAGEGAPAPPPRLAAADVAVLLDCLAAPALRPEALSALSAAVGAGCLSANALLAAVEALHAGGGEPAAGAEAAEPRRPPASAAQAAFVAAHPAEARGGEGGAAIPPDVAAALRLRFPVAEASGGAAAFASPPSAAELDGLLAAARALLVAKGRPAAKAAGARLYHAVHRLRPAPADRRRLLGELAEAAAGGAPAEALLGAEGEGDSLPPAEGANEVAAAVAAVPPLPSMSALAPASALAAQLLAALGESGAPGAGREALAAALGAAAAARGAAAEARREAAAAAARAEAAAAAGRAATAAAEAAHDRARRRASEAEAELSRARAEHSAEVSGAASGRREQQAAARALEQQVEWVRAERDEERAARARDSREGKERLAEAEAALARLKTTRRDEQKRIAKEARAAGERAREAEEAAARAEAEAGRLRGDAGAAARAERAAGDARRRAEAAERALAERDAELAAARAGAAATDARLRAALEAAAAAEGRAVAAAAGADLEAAPVAEIEAAARAADAALRRANALLARRGRPAVGGATPAARAAPASPAAALPLGAAAGLESASSLASLAPAGSGGLFAGGGWGLGGAGGGLGAPGADAAAAGDASMEKLLGLLPSDLLHS